MSLVPLSTILNRMKRYQTVSTVEDQDLVRDLDEAIRTLRRMTRFPWVKQTSTIKVFDDVLEYPVASDHDELAFLDNPKNEGSFADRPRFRFTSHKEFLENINYRNDLAEIWEDGTLFLGIRYDSAGNGSTLLDSAEEEDNYAVANDADSATEDSVTFKKGNKSIKVAITNSADVATVTITYPTAKSDSNYKKKYHFKLIYLDAVPTSIEMRLQTDGSNYLATTVTTQFSGKAFQADAWNLIAQDLNTATPTGTLDSDNIASEQFILNGAATGTYFFDESHLREWSLLDYHYYSVNNVALIGSSVANQEFFMNASEVYSSDSNLVGEKEWVDVVMYDALETTLTDKENRFVLDEIKEKRDTAWDDLVAKYPSLEPVMVTNRYRFQTDYLTGQ